MNQIEEIIEAIIYKQHGWAVADQFMNVYWDRSEDNICEQNFNALDYIVYTLNDLIKAEDVFTEEAIREMMELRSDIKRVTDEIPTKMKNDYQ